MTNSMVLADSLGTAVSALGQSANFGVYDICEVMNTAFVLYNVSPVVFINVLNPAIHFTTVAPFIAPIIAGQVTITDDVIFDSLVVKNHAGSVTYVLGTDYSAAWSAPGNPGTNETLVLSISTTGAIGSAVDLLITYSKINPSAVTDASIIGTFNPTTDVYTGIQMLPLVYPAFDLVPGFLLCPKFSYQSDVAAAMKVAVSQIDGRFRGKAVIDMDTSNVRVLQNVLTEKNTKNFTDPGELLCWPMVGLGGQTYHLGSHIACKALANDQDHDGIPYDSPSSLSLQIDSIILADGTNVAMTETRANQLNAWGVTTARNENGWISWGNLLACYPVDTDPADMWINVSRMFDFVGNSLAITLRQYLDRAGNRALIEHVTDTQQWFLNSLIARGALLSGTVEFRRTENPDTELANGHYTFHLMILPPTPAQWIQLLLEFDFSGFETLFTAPTQNVETAVAA